MCGALPTGIGDTPCQHSLIIRILNPTARRRPWPVGPALAAILIAVSAVFSYAQGGASDPARAFMAATRDYAQMHRRLEGQIGPIEINSSIDQINRIIQQLAAAIRAERPDAKQGDFFTPALAPELRARINEALLADDFTVDDVIGRAGSTASTTSASRSASMARSRGSLARRCFRA